MSLKAARVNAGLTQKEAADKLNVSNGTLCNWENGLSFPNAKQIVDLCNLYGLSYDNINFLPEDSL
jgi:transcriptional regulator with XRE-family HTH domain